MLHVTKAKHIAHLTYQVIMVKEPIVLIHEDNMIVIRLTNEVATRVKKIGKYVFCGNVEGILSS